MRIEVPEATLSWLLDEADPAVAMLARLRLLGEEESALTRDLRRRVNGTRPVATILEAQHEDGGWAPPARDYQKYGGSLWQVHFLGELWADGDDERVRRAAEYAFSRQRPDGAFSCNGREDAAIPCLTANVARALARLGYSRDERVVRALAWVADKHGELGYLGCSQSWGYNLNGYCHMYAPKALLLLAEVPRELWPDGAERLRDDAVSALRDKQVIRCLPEESREFQELVWSTKAAERPAVRERYLAEHPVLHFKEKPGWLRLGYPLSYNSDALEALASLAETGEPRRPEYDAALDVVARAADKDMRWRMRNSFNGKMLADVERKGEPSKWLTLRALMVLDHFAG